MALAALGSVHGGLDNHVLVSEQTVCTPYEYLVGEAKRRKWDVV